jgi:hypothetical protein
MSCSRPSPGQQSPPARAAASAVRALRNARGSLLLTTGTASTLTTTANTEISKCT